MFGQDSEHLNSVLKNFLTFPDEKIILVKRQHRFVLLPPLFIIGALTLTLIILSYVALIILLSFYEIFFISVLIIFNITVLLIAKNIVEWYFHIYIVTNRKLLEVYYVPLSSYVINDVLLDQVKCTEIDIRTNGFFYELLNIGDVAITFDRPTHQNEYIFSQIKDARGTGALLTNHLIKGSPTEIKKELSWHRSKLKKHKYYLIDPIDAENE